MKEYIIPLILVAALSMLLITITEPKPEIKRCDPLRKVCLGETHITTHKDLRPTEDVLFRINQVCPRHYRGWTCVFYDKQGNPTPVK